ncbi:porin [Roseateles noduli]|uniref:porin n=1 Tax=Roseateles noduli TaxID=2052484 RepID=UPI003D659E75
MKQCLVFALVAASCAVHAQSTTTVFGIVDLGGRQVKNGDRTLNSLASGGINSSRLGVRGSEDLGGGLLAQFWLESGFNADTGVQTDAARFWSRRSTVSLVGGFGELRLGRDFATNYLAYLPYEPFGTNGIASGSKFFTALGTGADTTVRADNMVNYYTPSGLGGFYGQLTVAPGEGSAGKKYAAGRAGYKAGDLDLQASYSRTDVRPPASADHGFKFATIGGSYDFGVVKLLAYVGDTRNGDQKNRVISLGATMPIGQGVIKAVFIDADASGRTATGASVADNDARQFALGYVHNLSKRTALYGTIALVHNDGRANYVVDSAPALAAGANSRGIEAGLRHSF